MCTQRTDDCCYKMITPTGSSFIDVTRPRACWLPAAAAAAANVSESGSSSWQVSAKRTTVAP